MARPKSNEEKGNPIEARRDSLDFRDWIYQPVLAPVEDFQLPKPEDLDILDQGAEGACTGFGLAAVINYLMFTRDGNREPASPQMLYEMARRHDHWAGASYEGSSARGAMKGWYKTGACSLAKWPLGKGIEAFTESAQLDALERPLGAFYRVLPKRSDLHAALQEVQVLFVTAATHEGWTEPVDGQIVYKVCCCKDCSETCDQPCSEHCCEEPCGEHDQENCQECSRRCTYEEEGGHAFAVIGYTEEGFLVQNSWGPDWGGVEFEEKEFGRFPGCAIWTYEDADKNLWDAWVVRLGRPLESLEALAHASTGRQVPTSDGTVERRKPQRTAIAQHFIHIDDGQFDPMGDYWSSPEQVQQILAEAMTKQHVLIYAHGGMTKVADAARRVQSWRETFDHNDIHEIHLIWESGLWATLKDLILGRDQFASERAGGSSTWLQRWIESATGRAGRKLWGHMKVDANLAFSGAESAGWQTLSLLREALLDPGLAQRPKLHLAGHSAGSIVLGELLQAAELLESPLSREGEPVLTFETATLYGAACNHQFFQNKWAPALRGQLPRVKNLYNFILDEESEQADRVTRLYSASLLYLVSRAYEVRGQEIPLLGMDEHLGDLAADDLAMTTIKTNAAPPSEQTPMPDRKLKTSATKHSDFDEDPDSMNSLLWVVTGNEELARSFSSTSARRGRESRKPKAEKPKVRKPKVRKPRS